MRKTLRPGPTGFIDRRAFLGGSLSLAALAALAACGDDSSSSSTKAAPALKAAKDGDTLNLYAWDGYFAPEVIDGFEKKYGITVKQTATASMNDMIQKITAKQPFDIAIQNSTFLQQVTSVGLLHQINHDALTNWGEVIEYFNDPYFDPGAKYSVGYAMAPVGLAYRKSKYTNLTKSWKDLWTNVDTDPKHVYLIDDYQISLSVALMYLGLDANSDKQDDLDKAVDAIRSIKGKLGGFNSTNTVQALSSGQATLLPSYTGNVYTALSQAKDAADLDFQLCKEGQLFNDDVMTIPINAPHTGNAMLFLDWVLAPEQMAANVKYIGYPVPTKTGMATYDTLVKGHDFLTFGTSLLSDTKAWQKGLTATQRTMWNAAWLKVQA
ncbi:polyamine ABC transporter substrate-binding protein [Cryptosporangium phraense]|uniref:Spermidine/putrescine ABC transporter substrate-binding protein n=1 Tax=Cryptosporangium phraense TaxID=2593070 RepID=A0A545ATX9_9ACTN|nr:spermidine/putrescine ABC transporter substrate-binding protein [Cryptosporangium phraense]TQS44782.1 spermidine/putrescine ABC transporter substrate-binding protein [Cryptosporangium phraense]